MKINSEGELSATEEAAMGEFIHQLQRMVGWCRLTASKLELKARLLSALESKT